MSRLIHTLLKLARLRWTGHVTRMSNERLPKKVFYGELKWESAPKVVQRNANIRIHKSISLRSSTYHQSPGNRLPKFVLSGVALLEREHSTMKPRASARLKKRVERKKQSQAIMSLCLQNSLALFATESLAFRASIGILSHQRTIRTYQRT